LPQRRGIVVRGDGYCFYRAIALWRDETSDRKHEEFAEQHPQVFQPLLFSSSSVEEYVKKSKISGTWAETVDISSCATLEVKLFNLDLEFLTIYSSSP